MYYYLKGELAQKQENFAVVDIGGVGYKIFTSQLSLDSVSGGSDVTFYTHVYVREDILDIYGFTSNDELTMFLHLLSVSGVGPKAALAILSIATPSQLVLAVLTDDAKMLTKASGVGAKVAQRVILELKDKMSLEDAFEKKLEHSQTPVMSTNSQVKNDAVLALTALRRSLRKPRENMPSPEFM